MYDNSIKNDFRLSETRISMKSFEWEEYVIKTVRERNSSAVRFLQYPLVTEGRPGAVSVNDTSSG